MEYIKIPLFGKRGNGKYTIVDGDYDGEYFSQFRWHLLSNGYVARGSYDHTTRSRSRIYLHHEVLATNKGFWRDHIDRDRLNNRSCNLRLVTPKENAHNRLIHNTDRTYMELTEQEIATRESLLMSKRLDYRRHPERVLRKAIYDRKRYLNKKGLRL